MIWSLRSINKNLTPLINKNFILKCENGCGSYADLAFQLAPFWRKAKIKGEVVIKDPFLSLIDKQSAKEFVENWEAMKTLPAAREALNEMLMARIEEKR